MKKGLAKMKIVIDISDADYEHIKNGSIVPIKYDNHIYDAIRSGIPLPKGHGRLIDADVLMKDIRENAESYYAEDYEWLDKASTVIEGDE